MVRVVHGIVSVCLALTGCVTVLPLRPGLPVSVPQGGGRDDTTNRYFTNGVPVCTLGPDCSEAAYEERFGNCSYRSTIPAVLACQDDATEDWMWCLTFQRSFQDECRGLSGAHDPVGPRRVCRRTCEEMSNGMDAYECHDRQRRCLSHTQFWLRLCRRDCNVKAPG